MVYTSGSQPGVRVPPGVREKSLRVRQIFFAHVPLNKDIKIGVPPRGF